MAVYPAGKFRNIRPGTNDPPITVIGAILHVDAGNSGSLFSYFNGPSRGIESHFFVRKDGVVEQYRDTGYEADANLKANSFIKGGKRYGYISIETQGYEKGEWNTAQLAAIKALLLWLSKTHKFPLRRCPAHTQSGVGYHVMFGAPGPWTPVSKSCPGPGRVKQFNNVLVPWFKTTTPPPVQEDEMTPQQMQEIKNFIEQRVKAYSDRDVKNFRQQLVSVKAKLDIIDDQVEPDPVEPADTTAEQA